MAWFGDGEAGFCDGEARNGDDEVRFATAFAMERLGLATVFMTVIATVRLGLATVREWISDGQRVNWRQ